MNKPPFNIGDILLGTSPYYKGVVLMITGETNPEDGTTPVKIIFDLLAAEGVMIKIKEHLYFHRDVLDLLKRRLIDFLNKKGEISTPQFKEMTRVSRKYTIPLIEYFDSTKLTIRVGEKRTLR